MNYKVKYCKVCSTTLFRISEVEKGFHADCIKYEKKCLSCNSQRVPSHKVYCDPCLEFHN